MLRGSVSPDPSKIPYGGFSPVRLQGSTTALFFRAHPSSRASLMRPQCSPSLHGGGLPLSRHAEHVGSAFASLSTSLPHGSFAPPGLCCPSASSLLRPDPPVLRSPPASPRGLRHRPHDHETFPALGHRPFPWCHHLYAGADDGCIGPLPSPPSIGLRPCGRGSAARYPTTRFSWEAISTLRMVFALAAAPSFARPPDGSDLSAPRTFA